MRWVSDVIVSLIGEIEGWKLVIISTHSSRVELNKSRLAIVVIKNETLPVNMKEFCHMFLDDQSVHSFKKYDIYTISFILHRG
jgi:hypothetical protein